LKEEGDGEGERMDVNVLFMVPLLKYSKLLMKIVPSEVYP